MVFMLSHISLPLYPVKSLGSEIKDIFIIPERNVLENNHTIMKET